MKHKLAPFALVNHKSLPRAMFVAVAVLLVSVSAGSAIAQSGLTRSGVAGVSPGNI